MEVSTTEKQSMAKLDQNPEETESNRPPYMQTAKNET